MNATTGAVPADYRNFHFCFQKFGSFRHPAFWMLMAAHVPYLFVERIGNSPAARSVLSAIFK